MKKNNNTVIAILFAVLGVSLLLYFILNNDEEDRYSWKENYSAENDQPYGTLFIRQLLEEYRPGQSFVLNESKPVHELLRDTTLKDSVDYIFIGHTLNLDDADTDALLNFIYSGNDAFIACTNLPFNVVDSIFISECSRDMFLEEQMVPAVTLNFYHTNLRTEKGYSYAYRNKGNDQPYYWRSLNKEIFCDSVRSTIPLGFQHPDQVNFIRLPYGKGNLYIHSNPLVFTNYFMVEPDKAEYAAGVFSHLRGRSMIWDEFSKAPVTENNAPLSSPISYILQHASLKYAWWMMLGSVVLYTFFAAKRKQRIIHVLAEKTNTSLEFVKMISTLHFQNGDHGDIARKKMKYFLYFVRARYGIHTQHFTEAHIRRLAEKSNVAAAEIEAIFKEFGYVERNTSVTEHGLARFYHTIDNFYKHCK